jgi:sugar/nucleoside kinase (ribokinase family)
VTALSADGDFIDEPIIDAYQRVDTNGAGDNFFAGFLYAHSKGHPLKQCLRYGSIAAGLCISSAEIVNPMLCGALIESEFESCFKA